MPDEPSIPLRFIPEPFPADPIGHRLCELFPYRWQAILADRPSDASQKPEWKTLTQYPLRPRALWKLWQDAAQLVGVRFGHTTHYGLIDLDATSPYHPSQTPDILRTIQAALEAIGLYRLIPIRSSWSGGLHLYIPLPEAVATFDLAIALKQVLEDQGLSLRQGQLEVFPNVKRYGKEGQFTEYNAHRLPLQPGSGSVLLTADLHPCPGSLRQFFQQWELAAAKQDLGELKQAIAHHRQHYRPYRPSGKNNIEQWQQDLLDDIEQGWSGPGQTNHLLKTLGCYGVVFLGLTGDSLSRYMEQTAIASPGYTDWCQHQHEISKRVKHWAIACENYYWPLGSNPKRSGNLHRDRQNNVVPFNRQRSEEAQDRIRAAVVELQTTGDLPDGVTARMKAIATLAKCSNSTLQKYRELWHPEWSVIVEPESVPAQVHATQSDPIDCPESLHREELHTVSVMKGRPQPERFLSPKEINPVFGEGSGRGNPGFPQVDLGVSWPVVAPPDDTIAGIQMQIRRLGWSLEQVQRFIAERFGGRRRSQLSDDELLLLLYYLQAASCRGD